MVPFIIGAHYGWLKLQDVESLVSREERNKLPITKVFAPNKYIGSLIQQTKQAFVRIQVETATQYEDSLKDLYRYQVGITNLH